MKKKWIAAVMLGALLLGGCGKKEEKPRAVTAPLLTEVPETLAAEPQETHARTEAETESVPETTEAPVMTEVRGEIEETVPVETGPQMVRGKVIKVESLNVREGPSVNTRVVKKLSLNEEVVIREGIVLDSVQWAHVEDGWVCLDYLQTDGPVPQPRGQEPGGMPGVVYHTDTLNVRSEASGGAEKTGQLNRNDLVVIYETENGWGRMDLGWVSMEYIQLQKDNAKISVTGGDWVPEHTPESDLHDFTAPSEGIYMDNPVEDYFNP